MSDGFQIQSHMSLEGGQFPKDIMCVAAASLEK